MLVVVGAPGEDAYTEGFLRAAQIWDDLGSKADAELLRIGPEPSDLPHKARMRQWIESLDTESPAPVWIVYLGHGTYNSVEGAKMNLVGKDVSTSELQAWLKPLQSPLVFIHGGSASGPFIPALSGPRRIIITATRSGNQQNYARFGEIFAETMASPSADIDRDGQVSVLEAFIMSSQMVDLFYREAGRLTTEHALLDDNGDGRGTPVTQFRGLRPSQPPAAGTLAEGYLARQAALLSNDLDTALTLEQLRLRETLEAELEALRLRKSELSEDSYYEQLEALLVQLAHNVYGELFPNLAE